MKQYKIEDILYSLTGITRANAPQQLYAGIRAKMQRQQPENNVRAFSLKPVFASVILLAFLCANIITLSSLKKNRQPATTTSGAEAFAKEYNLSAQSFGQ